MPVALAGAFALAASGVVLYVEQVRGVTGTDAFSAAQGIAFSRQARARSPRPGDVVQRFSMLAVASVALLVLTGGIAILVKIALLALTIALGARNFLVHGPLLRRSRNDRARWHLARNSVIEIALVAVVLAATAVLTALVPPAQAATAPLDELRRVEGTRIGRRGRERPRAHRGAGAARCRPGPRGGKPLRAPRRGAGGGVVPRQRPHRACRLLDGGPFDLDVAR